jgi:hypothetical protein
MCFYQGFHKQPFGQTVSNTHHLRLNKPFGIYICFKTLFFSLFETNSSSKDSKLALLFARKENLFSNCKFVKSQQTKTTLDVWHKNAF